MNSVIVAVLGLIGAILGFVIFNIADKIISYKLSNKRLTHSYAMNNTGVFPKVLFCLISTIIWISSALKADSYLTAFFLSALFIIAILIAIIDFRISIIPNELVLAMIVVGIIFQFLNSGIKSLLNAFLSMLIMMILFTAVAAVVGFSKIGAGDIKLAGAMGISLGYPNIFSALVIMSISLVIFIAVGLVLKKLTMHSRFPFAPFMMLGMIIGLVYIVFDLKFYNGTELLTLIYH